MKQASIALLFLFVALCSATRLQRRDDCADCRGFPPDCSCEDYQICKSQGCDTGECQPDCPGKRRKTMLGELLKRKPNDCADCYGFPPDCSCEDYLFCKSQGCDTGECQPDCSDKRRRMMAGQLLKRKPDDCADCYGFPPDCSCEDYLFCKSQGCDTGECQPDCPGKRNIMMSRAWFKKEGAPRCSD
ncbi:uncharacterized protein LOC110045478 [Orbicella faveolata]|uniref:uncharacterized protein LOC110045478 n=1 Tax=Orbicella faveolata TaxID=48498 RepID=UPI0009E4EC24|nr:uncharacterized protein LOC110045478 [Orbicella faveolata]